MSIYIASSWRNPHQPMMVNGLRGLGFNVYDFRHPHPDDYGFSWGDIAAEWDDWTLTEYRDALQHPLARAGFQSDMNALRASTHVILLLPCGNSAHLEAGWAVAAGKWVAAFALDGAVRPELMYGMFDLITDNFDELHAGLREVHNA